MIRKILESRITLVVVAALMFWIGWFNLDSYLSGRHFFNFVFALVCLPGAIGLLLGQRWSRLAVYSTSTLFLVQWIWWVILALATDLRYDSAAQTFFGLLIALVPTAASAICSYAVYRHFAGESAENPD